MYFIFAILLEKHLAPQTQPHSHGSVSVPDQCLPGLSEGSVPRPPSPRPPVSRPAVVAWMAGGVIKRRVPSPSGSSQRVPRRGGGISLRRGGAGLSMSAAWSGAAPCSGDGLWSEAAPCSGTGLCSGAAPCSGTGLCSGAAPCSGTGLCSGAAPCSGAGLWRSVRKARSAVGEALGRSCPMVTKACRACTICVYIYGLLGRQGTYAHCM